MLRRPQKFDPSSTFYLTSKVKDRPNFFGFLRISELYCRNRKIKRIHINFQLFIFLINNSIFWYVVLMPAFIKPILIPALLFHKVFWYLHTKSWCGEASLVEQDKIKYVFLAYSKFILISSSKKEAIWISPWGYQVHYNILSI